MKNLNGKCAFITGGASGIGMGMTRAFLGETMKVVIADISESNLAKADLEFAGRADVMTVRVDVTDRTSVQQAVDHALERFGPLDVVCANAGIGGGGGAVADPTFDGWDRVMAVNLDGVVNTVKATVRSMRARSQGGHIVVTSSVAGITALPFEHGAYTASKFAVRGLGESLRLSLAGEGIGVSILCPGLTDTGILGGADEETVEFQKIEGAMNPLEVGYAVVRGIRDNAPYIFTHAEFGDEFRMLFDELLDAIPRDQAIPPDRAEFERGRRTLCDSLRHLPALD
jgi:NAD(P)-dependent dehydrogenase (short-subunit alcohol dehydrogenase family)